MEENNVTKSGIENKEDKGNNTKKGIKRFISAIWDFLKIIIIAAIIVLPIRYFLFQPFVVKGESMVPNFQSGDYLIIEEIFYKVINLKRGDVVVFKYPLDTSQRFIKRIIGLPGETVNIKNGEITISKDGKNSVLDEKEYLTNILTMDNLKIDLKNDEYFVMGDNRQFSYDSRRWGVLSKKYIIGRAVFRVFPIKNMSQIVSPNY